MDQGTIMFAIHHFTTVGSTNDVAADYGHGALVLADRQTAGRGQRGNRWESLSGVNALFSAVVEPTHRRVDEQFGVSMGTALAVCDLAAELGVEARVKWPNDIYVGDKKLCGILIEHSSMGAYLSRSVVGVGINVGQCDFPQEAGRPTSLHLEGARSATVRGVVEAWGAAFARYYQMPIEALLLKFRAKMWRGEGFFAYKDTATGEVFTARVAALDGGTGLLTLETPTGERRDYYFKEVEFIL